MAKWILIHDQQNYTIWLNVELIWKIHAYTNQYTPGVRSMIYKSDTQDDYFQCRETPDELMALIDKASLLAAQVSGDT